VAPRALPPLPGQAGVYQAHLRSAAAGSCQREQAGLGKVGVFSFPLEGALPQLWRDSPQQSKKAFSGAGLQRSRRGDSNPGPPPYHAAQGRPPGLVRSGPVWDLVPGATPRDWLLGQNNPNITPGSPEKHPRKTGVSGGRVGSERTGADPGTLGFVARADVAQMVEHLHGKEGVRGSSPRVGFARILLQQTLLGDVWGVS
jgi:hypothetical protein